MRQSTLEVLDPVAAYERVAPYFFRLAERRRRYLESIDSRIVSHVPAESTSLLDIGAGDGKRTMRIATKSGIHQVVLLEPSFAMSKSAASSAEIWRIRAEKLREQTPEITGRRFDVITCLWNVLGHLQPAKTRTEVLQQLAGLLSPTGLLFLDVNHRYNARAYGLLKSVGRFFYDQLRPSEQNGDVTVTWDLKDIHCRTYGHFFTHKEILGLARAAGLSVQERMVVDYDSGETRKFGFEGNLLYVFRRNSASDSSSAAQTS